MQCTWLNCDNDGSHSQTDMYGDEWACLCGEHHRELDQSINDADAHAVVRCWVRAKSDHPRSVRERKAAAEGITAIGRLGASIKKGD